MFLCNCLYTGEVYFLFILTIVYDLITLMICVLYIPFSCRVCILEALSHWPLITQTPSPPALAVPVLQVYI